MAEESWSQDIRGIVVDNSDNSPLEFVHIGILGKNAGTVSREDGTFEIDLTQFDSSDTIVISHIGYVTKFLTHSEVMYNNHLSIKMDRLIITTPQIVIKGASINTYISGRRTTTKITTGHSGKSNYGIGKEWGLKIKYDNEPYYIKDINFHTRFNTVDSVLFRLNIYQLNEAGIPGNSLLKNIAYTKSYNKDKWISASIIDQGLLVSTDIVVTFETVRIWYKGKGNNYLFFTHGSGYKEGTTFSKESSHDKWRINEAGPIAMYVTCIKKEQ